MASVKGKKKYVSERGLAACARAAADIGAFPGTQTLWLGDKDAAGEYTTLNYSATYGEEYRQWSAPLTYKYPLKALIRKIKQSSSYFLK